MNRIAFVTALALAAVAQPPQNTAGPALDTTAFDPRTDPALLNDQQQDQVRHDLDEQHKDLFAGCEKKLECDWADCEEDELRANEHKGDDHCWKEECHDDCGDYACFIWHWNENRQEWEEEDCEKRDDMFWKNLGNLDWEGINWDDLESNDWEAEWSKAQNMTAMYEEQGRNYTEEYMKSPEYQQQEEAWANMTQQFNSTLTKFGQAWDNVVRQHQDAVANATQDAMMVGADAQQAADQAGLGGAFSQALIDGNVEGSDRLSEGSSMNDVWAVVEQQGWLGWLFGGDDGQQEPQGPQGARTPDADRRPDSDSSSGAPPPDTANPRPDSGSSRPPRGE